MANFIATLPLELLHAVSYYLDPADFIKFCGTCPSFQYAPDLRFASEYWRNVVQTKFPFPNLPSLAADDGKKWMILYQRLLGGTSVFGWGRNDQTCLMEEENILDHTEAGWPIPVDSPNRDSMIVDLQCGAWSTLFLMSTGSIVVRGSLHQGQRPVFNHELSFGFGHDGLTSETHEEEDSPSGYPEARYFIVKFSITDTHVLGLSQTGCVWSWTNANYPGIAVLFPPSVLDIAQGNAVTRVVADPHASSAYITGQGVIVWAPVEASRTPTSDQATISNHWMVAGTKPRWILKNGQESASPTGDMETVQSWVMLIGCVIYITNTGRIFFSTFHNWDHFEITLKRDVHSTEPHIGRMIDIQGRRRHFGLLDDTGSVLIGDSDLLQGLLDNHRGTQPTQSTVFRRIPALQYTGVQRLTFGTHHFHALHTDGTISSYGKEQHFCGALGLGRLGVEVVRGVKADGFGGDAYVLPECMTTGRRVWFERERVTWMNHVRNLVKDEREAEGRLELTFRRNDIRAEVSEWFEGKLRQWEDSALQSRSCKAQDSNVKDDDDDGDDDLGLPAHFVLAVAAGGSHTVALVLVNEKKTKRVRSFYQGRPQGADHEADSWIWEDDTFPRLRLRSGEVMPGAVEVEDWQAPEWKLGEGIEAVRVPVPGVHEGPK